MRSIVIAVTALALLGCSDDLTDTGALNTFAATLSAGGTATVNISGGGLTGSVDYSGLSGDATVAHIHEGGVGEDGDVIYNLCGTGAPVPDCPAGMSGALDVADGEAAAGFTFEDVVDALRSPGTGAYVNIHTVAAPGGESRGNLFVQ